MNHFAARGGPGTISPPRPKWQEPFAAAASLTYGCVTEISLRHAILEVPLVGGYLL